MNTPSPEYLRNRMGDLGRIVRPSELGEDWVVVERRTVVVTESHWRLDLVDTSTAPEHPMDTIARLRDELAAALKAAV